ncbi:MAG: prohibitin family protein [Chloroflexi bacterium]|nr:prohibitin family protein [Chloroflexota bacterium]
MLLERSLDFIVPFVWLTFFIIVAFYIIATARRVGLLAAFRALLSLKIPALGLLLLVTLTLLIRGLIFIDPQEVGVVITLIQPDGYRDRPLRSGLRVIAPLLEQVERYPIYWQTYTMSSLPLEGQKPGDDSIKARTSDGQEVAIDCSIIFQLDPEQVIRVHIDWQKRYVDDFVRPVVRGIVRTQVSQYTVDEVNSYKRLDLETDLNRQVRVAFQEKGFILDRFILRNIGFSPEYAASVEKKQIALQGKIESEYQAEQVRKLAQGQADQVTILAKADAEAIRVRAQADAAALQLIGIALAKDQNLLIYRYIEKLSPAIRVMLLPSNSPFLLPLPADVTDLGYPTPTPKVPVSLTNGTTVLPTPTLPSTSTPTRTPTPSPTPVR